MLPAGAARSSNTSLCSLGHSERLNTPAWPPHTGALNDKRLQFFLERFESLRQDRDQGGHSGHSGGEASMPPFHYGSHYSNAGIVSGWLCGPAACSGWA